MVGQRIGRLTFLPDERERSLGNPHPRRNPGSFLAPSQPHWDCLEFSKELQKQAKRWKLLAYQPELPDLSMRVTASSLEESTRWGTGL